METDAGTPRRTTGPIASVKGWAAACTCTTPRSTSCCRRRTGLTLDVGCGEGRLTRELVARGYNVVGVDASTALVDEAARPTRRAATRWRQSTRCRSRTEPRRSPSASTCCRTSTTWLPPPPSSRACLRPAATLADRDDPPVAHAGTLRRGDAASFGSRDYWNREREAVQLGEHTVHHERRTIEDYLSDVARAPASRSPTCVRCPATPGRSRSTST